MDIEKTIQFILDTQAKHEVAIQQWDERFLKFQQEVGQRFATLVDVSMSLAANLERLGQETDQRFRETEQRFRETEQRFRETDGRFREVSERFRDTDTKLNVLVDTVDKLIKRNGSRN